MIIHTYNLAYRSFTKQSEHVKDVYYLTVICGFISSVSNLNLFCLMANDEEQNKRETWVHEIEPRFLELQIFMWVLDESSFLPSAASALVDGISGILAENPTHHWQQSVLSGVCCDQ